MTTISGVHTNPLYKSPDSSGVSPLYAPGGRTSVDIEQLEKFDFATAHVTIGGAQTAPQPALGLKTRIADFFSSIGTKIAEAFGAAATKAQAVASALKKHIVGDAADTVVAIAAAAPTPLEQRERLIALLPAGVDVSEDGVISGKVTATAYATSPTLGKYSGQPLRDVVEQSCAALLDAKNNNYVNCCGVDLCTQALSDFFRLNIRIGSGATAWSSADCESTNEKTRVEAVTTKLCDLAGGEAATKALSAVFNQQLAFFATSVLALSDGTRSPLTTAANELTHRLAEGGKMASYRKTDGTLSDVDASQIGGLTFSIDKKEDGHFVIAVGGDCYFGSARNADGVGTVVGGLPGMDRAVIKGQIDFSLEVEANESGITVVGDPLSAIEFSGMIAATDR